MMGEMGEDVPGRVMLRSSKTMSTCWRPGELEDSRKPAVKSELKKPWVMFASAESDKRGMDVRIG